MSWFTDNSGQSYQTPDTKPPSGNGIQVSTPDGKGGTWNGGAGAVTKNK